AGQYLSALVRENNNQLSTGFLGFKPLLPALSATGNSDMAYTLIQDTAYPSLGFEVVNGATTIWERWNSFTKDKGFENNAGMNSFNHYAFGAVCEWMFQNMAGIQPVDAGFKTFVIKPEIADGGIRYVNADYHSGYGKISVSWKENDASLQLQVIVPVNTRASVYLPATNASTVLCNGKPLYGNTDILLTGKSEQRQAIVEVGSGTYQFTITPQA